MRSAGHYRCSLQAAACCVVICGIFLATSAAANTIVDPGPDCWTVGDACDGSTQVGFATQPIPADFFGPGSDPFDGQVYLKGESGGGIDVVVLRLGTMSLPPEGQCVTVDTALVELDLVSCEPITVTYNGGQDPEEWDVDVSESQVFSPVGSMGCCLHPPYADRGTIPMSLVVLQPRFTFTNVSDPGEVRIFDTGDEGIPAIQLLLELPLPGGHFLAATAAAGSPCDPFNFHAGATIVDDDVCCVEMPHADAQGGHSLHLLAAGCKTGVYGDVWPVPSGDGAAEGFDILCILDAANNLNTFGCLNALPSGNAAGDIYPCAEPDGAVEGFDILAVLDAANAINWCPVMCPPG